MQVPWHFLPAALQNPLMLKILSYSPHIVWKNKCISRSLAEEAEPLWAVEKGISPRKQTRRLVGRVEERRWAGELDDGRRYPAVSQKPSTSSCQSAEATFPEATRSCSYLDGAEERPAVVWQG